MLILCYYNTQHFVNVFTLYVQVPSRVYIPHCQVTNSSEELVCKVSVNGGSWQVAGVVSPTAKITEQGV